MTLMNFLKNGKSTLANSLWPPPGFLSRWIGSRPRQKKSGTNDCEFNGAVFVSGYLHLPIFLAQENQVMCSK